MTKEQHKLIHEVLHDQENEAERQQQTKAERHLEILFKIVIAFRAF